MSEVRGQIPDVLSASHSSGVVGSCVQLVSESVHLGIHLSVPLKVVVVNERERSVIPGAHNEVESFCSLPHYSLLVLTTIIMSVEAVAIL